MEELVCTHNTHTLIITLLACHRHLEKHKEGDLNQNPEMIFPPVTTTTKLCASFYCTCVHVCVGDHMQRVSTGDIQRFLRGSLGRDRFSSSVVTKTHLYQDQAHCQNMEMEDQT